MCYVPASRYKDLEGKACGSMSSENHELPCTSTANIVNASNLHWPTEVASVQSRSGDGLYKGEAAQQELSRAEASRPSASQLSLSHPANRTQAEYIAWLESVWQVDQASCFREERRYKREGPLPITPEKHVVEDSRRKRRLAVTFRSLNKDLPREELAVWRLPQ